MNRVISKDLVEILKFFDDETTTLFELNDGKLSQNLSKDQGL